MTYKAFVEVCDRPTPNKWILLFGLMGSTILCIGGMILGFIITGG